MRGFWDELGGVLGSVGVTTASATAVARAYASPTLENIRAVEAAFREAGTSPPPELMNSLYQRYYDSIRSSPYYQAGTVQTGLTNLLPWIAGGILIFILLKNRRLSRRYRRRKR